MATKKFSELTTTRTPSSSALFAIADSSPFFTIFAPFLLLNDSKVTALSADMPRIWSATKRIFCGDKCVNFNVADVVMF